MPDIPTPQPVEVLLGDDRIVQLLLDDGQLLALTAFGFILQHNSNSGVWTQFPAPISVNLARQLQAQQEEAKDGAQET